MNAAWHGHEEIVKLLVQNSANVNEKNHIGNTALMIAAGNGHIGDFSLIKE